MRASKKAERAMKGLTEMMAQYGISPEVIAEVKENVPQSAEAKSQQGEAVLLFLESPAKFTAKVCKRCGEPFGTNYRSVAYCSDSCRVKEVSKQLGVKWDHLRADNFQRWGGEPPLIVPPDAFKRIERLCQWFSDNQVSQPQNPIQNHQN